MPSLKMIQSVTSLSFFHQMNTMECSLQISVSIFNFQTRSDQRSPAELLRILQAREDFQEKMYNYVIEFVFTVQYNMDNESRLVSLVN